MHRLTVAKLSNARRVNDFSAGVPQVSKFGLDELDDIVSHRAVIDQIPADEKNIMLARDGRNSLKCIYPRVVGNVYIIILYSKMKIRHEQYFDFRVHTSRPKYNAVSTAIVAQEVLSQLSLNMDKFFK